MTDDRTVPDVKPAAPENGICPEPIFPVQNRLGQMSVNWGQACIMERCGKYQACKVLPRTMAEILAVLEERLP